MNASGVRRLKDPIGLRGKENGDWFIFFLRHANASTSAKSGSESKFRQAGCSGVFISRRCPLDRGKSNV